MGMLQGGNGSFVHVTNGMGTGFVTVMRTAAKSRV